jgi:hypothetical protein
VHEEHPAFKKPNDPNIKVWRYIDFTKYVSLLETSKLYFTRADKFLDPFEGSYPKMNPIIQRQTFEQLAKEMPDESRSKFLKNTSNIRSSNKEWRRYIGINCWHANEHESAAMWSLYLKSNEGVAIQSTYSKLCKSFKEANESVLIGEVSYIDYDRDYIQEGYLFNPFMHKRKSFAHEREVRALIWKPPTSETRIDFSIETIDHGVYVNSNIEELIEGVYICPAAPTWFHKLVENVTIRYGHRFNMHQSKLNEEPVY